MVVLKKKFILNSNQIEIQIKIQFEVVVVEAIELVWLWLCVVVGVVDRDVVGVDDDDLVVEMHLLLQS